MNQPRSSSSARLKRPLKKVGTADPAVSPANVGNAISASVAPENAKGLRLLPQTEDKIEELGVSDPEGIYKVAQAFAVLGDKAAALHCCATASEAGSSATHISCATRCCKICAARRNSKELMKQAQRRHEQFKSTFFGSATR